MRWGRGMVGGGRGEEVKSKRLVGSEKDDKWRETIINEASSALEYVHINIKRHCCRPVN